MTEHCKSCREIRRWNEDEYLEEPIDEFYTKAMRLLRNKREKHEILEVIAKLLRDSQGNPTK